MRTVRITAHRGSSARAPENTLAALRLAVEDGADYAEVDVQRTADGIPVLLHDATLKRVARDPRRLEQVSRAELSRMEVGGWFSDAYRGEPVPTLLEAVNFVRGRMGLNLELKYGRADLGLAPTVLEVLRREDLLNQCILTSMNLAAVEQVRRLEPQVRVGLILTTPVQDLRALDVDLLSIPLEGATPEVVELVHRSGREVHVWTVNRTGDMRRMIRQGVDNIITDKPDVLRSMVNQTRAGETP